jgi:hypothetical protein
MHELEVQAQKAAEFRLAAANEILWNEEFDGELSGSHDWQGDAADAVLPRENLAGPYCGCDTCLVREVLDAAWPYLYRLAHDANTAVPYWPVES